MNNNYFSQESLEKVKSLFSAVNIAYYLGAFLVIAAMMWFMSLVHYGLGLSCLALIYSLVFILVGRKLWFSDKFNMAGGLFFTLAVCMAYPFVYGVQQYMGFLPVFGNFTTINYINQIILYAAVALSSLVMLYFVRFSVLMVPLIYSLWSLVTWISAAFSGFDNFTLNRGLVQVLFSFGVLLSAYVLDKKREKYFAFWGYVGGMIAFQYGLYDLSSCYLLWNWGNTTDPSTGSVIFSLGRLTGLATGFFVNILLMLISMRFNNKIIAIFGCFGAIWYYFSVIWEYFSLDYTTVARSLVISLTGIIIFVLADVYRKNREKFGYSVNISRLSLLSIVYYAGVLFILNSLSSVAILLAWDYLPSGSALAIALVSLVYMLLFMLLGYRAWFSGKYKIGGEILFTLAICMVPIFVYAVLRFAGFGPYWNYHIESATPGHYYYIGDFMPLFVSAATLIASLIMLYFVRFSLLAVPIIISLWYMFIVSRYGYLSGWPAIIFGAVILLISYFVDCRTKEKFAFWGYIGGMIALQFGFERLVPVLYLFGGLPRNTAGFIICFLIYLMLMLISVLLDNKVTLVFSIIGALAYYFTLAECLFRGTIGVPLAISLMGISVFLLTIFYVKNREKIDNEIQSLIPKFILVYQPKNRVMKK